MRLILWTCVAMVAFAANSVLTRMAVGPGHMEAVGFAVVRLVAGAGMLALLVAVRGGGRWWPGWRGRGVGVAGLLVYLFAFSAAYGTLDAGVGALILFGAVQVTMFAGAVWAAEAVPARRWLGAGLALVGLAVQMAGPVAGQGVAASALMALAGLGWGAYSLAARGVSDALAATAWNFVLAVPVALAALWAVPLQAGAMTPYGVALAVLSGAVTSGMGYALWYGLVPRLGAARAGVAQLTVPLIAAFAGAVLLGEGVGGRFVLAAALVLGGVAVASRQSGLTRR